MMLKTDRPMPSLTVPVGRQGDRQLRVLLHPTERSRFALALVVTGIVTVGGAAVVAVVADLATLLSLVGTLLLVGPMFWLSMHLFRAHLLGHAARVSGDNLPEIQAVLDQIRAQLSYDRPVDVYVMDKVESHALLMKFLSTRVILLGGDFVAETLSEERRAELTFLIARFIGALKAKHMRLQPIRLAIAALEKLLFLNVFLYPYDRATVYSGDQIGLACCGDLRAALRVLGGFMVGTELAPRLGLRGILDQAVSVRSRWLPRLRQLFLSHPHLTNRYLNLLAFAQRVEPPGFVAFQVGLDERTRGGLPAALARAPGAARGDGRRAWALAATLVALATAVIVLGLRVIPSAPAAPTTVSGAVVPTSSLPATTVQPPAPTSPPVELASSAVASASSTTPSSVDAGGHRVSYDASNVIDRKPSTAWRTRGDGRGETLTLAWERPVRVAAIGLIPGYDKRDPYDGTDRFLQNRRVTAARITFSDGSAWDVTITDSRELQLFRIEGITDSVTIEILATVPGQPGFNDTVISEMSVLGGDA